MKELLAWLDEGGNLYYSGIQPALIHRARYWLAQGEVTKTASWLKEIGIQLDADPAAETTELYLLLSRVLIARKQAGKAKRLLDSLLPSIEHSGRLGNLIETLVLLAVASQA